MSREQQFLKSYKEALKPIYKHYSVQYLNGKITKVVINQSMIGTMFSTSKNYFGNEREYCPKNIQEVYIKGVGNVRNVYMERGIYFEERTIEPESDRKTIIPLTSSGKKSAIHTRLDDQIDMFPSIAKQFDMIIMPDYRNCQVENIMRVDGFDDIQVFLKMKLDIVTPFLHEGKFYESAVVDIKTTGDLNNYWSKPESIDIAQGVTYSLATKLPFFYLVFDYSTAKRHKAFRVATSYGCTDDELNECKLRDAEMGEIIRKTAYRIIQHESEGYDYVPSGKNCKGCPLNPDHGGTCVQANRDNVL